MAHDHDHDHEHEHDHEHDEHEHDEDAEARRGARRATPARARADPPVPRRALRMKAHEVTEFDDDLVSSSSG